MIATIVRALVVAALAGTAVLGAVAAPAMAVDGGGEPAYTGDSFGYVGRLVAERRVDASLEVGERCGAVLVAPSWALTARHCVSYDAPARYRDGDFAPADLTLAFGSRRADGAGGHQARVVEIVRGDEDIALLRLAADVPLAPVRLADAMPPEESAVLALGWGRRTGAAPLEAADMRVDQPSSGPSWFHPGSTLVTVPDADAPQPGSANHGDSGGPLLVAAPAGGHVLAGVARSAIRGRGPANAWVRTDPGSPVHAWMATHVPASTSAHRSVPGMGLELDWLRW